MVELHPEEELALSVGISQVKRGEDVMSGIAFVCVLALARVTGKWDYTKEEY